MRKLDITPKDVYGGVLTAEGGARSLTFDAKGGGIRLDRLIGCSERYFTFFAETPEDHSVVLGFDYYSREAPDGPSPFGVRFGIMPQARVQICIDLSWSDAHVLFPGHTPGQRKVVCHGRRVDPDEVSGIVLRAYPCFHDVRLTLSDLRLTDERPTEYPLPDEKLIDEFGQYKKKSWPLKIDGIGALKERLTAAANLPDEYAPSGWDAFGGTTGLKLTEGTGFFSKIKKNGRWYLTDPLGNAFFSVGPDGVRVSSDCRIDDFEKTLDWVPDPADPIYGPMYAEPRYTLGSEIGRTPKLFSFTAANLYKVFGDDWREQWARLVTRQLKAHGMNTLANWSDDALFGVTKIPYVTSLPRFPGTKQTIFRDFPDVYSDEFAANAAESAKELAPRRDDPYMIGYFLRNEPSWAFVDGLILADEALYNPAATATKDALIASLRAKYETPEALSAAWGRAFASFDDLRAPIANASKLSPAAMEDQRAFSREMLRLYSEIPSKACRAVDPNHMILGMRWAWISHPDLITGWENFDVFSINCYAIDPTARLDNVRDLGCDLPVMIGEFHAGALDSGLTATGLEGLRSQADRGLAYRYYCERVAAHPYGVGCHYFQCYDQFELGRFDGENYNIGLFDICSQPYADMMAQVLACSEGIYDVIEGKKAPLADAPESIPMVAY